MQACGKEISTESPSLLRLRNLHSLPSAATNCVFPSFTILHKSAQHWTEFCTVSFILKLLQMCSYQTHQRRKGSIFSVDVPILESISSLRADSMTWHCDSNWLYIGSGLCYEDSWRFQNSISVTSRKRAILSSYTWSCKKLNTLLICFLFTAIVRY